MPTPTFHYVYGSGMHGCLYDYGPNFSDSVQVAIDSLVTLFNEQLEEGETSRMRNDLRAAGYHKFENPINAGAEYCEITPEPGPCPEQE